MYQIMSGKAMSVSDNAAYIGQPGEVVTLTDTGQTVTHDGVTLGGRPGSPALGTTVAATGTVQGDAAALGLGPNVVTGADGTKGVILPAVTGARVLQVKNNAAAILKVYPRTGGIVNALAANGAISMASLTSATFMTVDSGATWFTIPLLPS